MKEKVELRDASGRKCCCSCKKNIRKREPDDGHINCYCEIDGHYIGYVESFCCVCQHWETAHNRTAGGG